MTAAYWWVAYIVTGVIVGLLATWTYRFDENYDGEFGKHWSDYLMALCPPMLMLWPFMAPDVVVDLWRWHKSRCDSCGGRELTISETFRILGRAYCPHADLHPVIGMFGDELLAYLCPHCDGMLPPNIGETQESASIALDLAKLEKQGIWPAPEPWGEAAVAERELEVEILSGEIATYAWGASIPVSFWDNVPSVAEQARDLAARYP